MSQHLFKVWFISRWTELCGYQRADDLRCKICCFSPFVLVFSYSRLSSSCVLSSVVLQCGCSHPSETVKINSSPFKHLIVSLKWTKRPNISLLTFQLHFTERSEVTLQGPPCPWQVTSNIYQHVVSLKKTNIQSLYEQLTGFLWFFLINFNDMKMLNCQIFLKIKSGSFFCSLCCRFVVCCDRLLKEWRC